MGDRFPGGVISKTPPEVTGQPLGDSNLYAWGDGPSLGIGANSNQVVASGVWALSDVLGFAQAGFWPPPFESSGNRSSPVSVGALTDWASAATGQHVLAVRSGGSLYSWGGNNYGAAGHNDTLTRSSPSQVGALTNWSKVDARSFTSAAIKTDGTMWTWGRDFAGMLGLNTNGVAKSSPVQVGALTNWAQVSVGGSHCVAVKTDGTLWSWGWNGDGQLGLNLSSAASSARSSPVQVGSLSTWASVSANLNHTLAVTTGNALFAWGSSSFGQLGTGNIINRSSPVQVGALTNWIRVSGGSFLSGAIKTDSTIWAWGNNNYGQLGDGTVVRRSSPVQVGALSNWSKLSVGDNRITAIKTDGTLWAWGRNVIGYLGDGTNNVFKSSPVQVGTLTTWSEVSATGSVSVAITTG